VKPGDVCRVRRDIPSYLPWAAPGSIVLVTEIVSDYMVHAKVLFGGYRDDCTHRYEIEHGALPFDMDELEDLK
jgi:hypothetical protein